jgi:P-type Cu+ transporter
VTSAPGGTVTMGTAPEPTAPVPAPQFGEPAPARVVRRRLLVAAALTAPVVVVSAVPSLQFPHWQWLALALACVVTGWGGWPLHVAPAPARRSATEVLVAVAVLAALGWSLAALLLGHSPVYPEVAAAMAVFGLAARLAAAQVGAGPHRLAVVVAVAAIATAAATLGFWLGSGSAQTAFSAAVAVLVAACPCAFAVAAPPAAERAARVDTVVLTEATVVDPAALRVHAVHATRGAGGTDALRLAGAIGRASDHPVGRAIAAAATVATGPLPGVAEFDEVPGLGGRGIVAEVVRRGAAEAVVVAHAVLAGRTELLAEHGIALPADLETARANAQATGRTAVAVAWDGVARAVLVIGAAARPTAAAAVQELRALGVTPMLLPADGAATAVGAAGLVGIRPDELVAGATTLERLRSEGRVVAVLGADEGQDVPAAHTDPLPAVAALRLARRTASVIRANALLAVVVSVAALPFAAAGAMDPTLAAAVVVTASAAVLANGLRLHRFPSTGG